MKDNRWRSVCTLMLMVTLLSLPGLAVAHNFVIGKAVVPIAISDGGELMLSDDDSIRYQPWNSTQLAGKVRIVQYIAGRKSAKKQNSQLIKAVEIAHFPGDVFQPTTIVNTDDVIFGTRYFVRGKIEKNKRRYAWAQFIIDAGGVGRNSWQLPQESSTIFVLNHQGQIVWAKDGALTENEVSQVIALLWVLISEQARSTAEDAID